MLDNANWLTVEEAAQRLKVSAQTIRRAIKSGKIKATKPFGNKGGWRIKEDEIKNLLEQRPAA